MMGDFSSEVHSPLLFTGAIQDWTALKWTPRYLSEILGDKKFRCKVLDRGNGEILPETECLHMMCSLKQYCDWLDGNCDKENPFKSLKTDQYSVYVDYKNMKDMFVDCPEFLEKVKWDNFGFPNRNGSESSIWIGSAGAYTPCHQDTYGFNLVTQIYGSKRWILFPPNQTSSLYPTRIPYEESSIFCEVNILKPNLRKHKLFEKATPYIVDLQQGDALYVPRHWWHFVQCTESSISINSWLPVEADQWSHVNEAVTKFLLTALVSSLPDVDMDKIVNPNEELVSPERCLKYIDIALKCYNGENCREARAGKDILNSEHSEVNAIERLESSNHFAKFIHKFKDSKVKTLHNFNPKFSAHSTVHHSENSDSPARKKIKLLESDSYTNSSVSLNSGGIEVFSIRSWTLDEFMKLIDIKQDDTESQSPFSQQCWHTDGHDSFGGQTEETVTESFINKVLNAVFKPSSIANISENILREIS